MQKTKTNERNGKPTRNASTAVKKLALVQKELRATRQERDELRRALYGCLKREALGKREQFEEEFKHASNQPPLDEYINELFK